MMTSPCEKQRMSRYNYNATQIVPLIAQGAGLSRKIWAKGNCTKS